VSAIPVTKLVLIGCFQGNLPSSLDTKGGERKKKKKEGESPVLFPLLCERERGIIFHACPTFVKNGGEKENNTQKSTPCLRRAKREKKNGESLIMTS